MSSINATSLNVVDIILLVIFFISIILGLARGLVSEILSLLVIAASFVVAILFTDSLTSYFTNTTAMQHVVNQTTTSGTSTAQHASMMLYGISFAILFFATLIIGTILKFLINLILGSSVLGFGNRMFGALFGAVRGYLIDLVFVFLIQLSPMSSQPWWQNSKLVPQFEPQITWLATKVSPMLDNVKSTFNLKTPNEVKK